MKVRMIFQPFKDCFSLNDALAHALNDERLTELSVVVAWAKESGLQHIRPSLQSFRARGGKASILLGVDAGGATLEGLRAAINDFDDARVLHDAKSRTFHPKLYMIAGESASVVIVGSGNLTKGGVSRNYEAGAYLEPWRSAPPPPHYCGTAPIPRHHRRPGPISRLRPTPE